MGTPTSLLLRGAALATALVAGSGVLASAAGAVPAPVHDAASAARAAAGPDRGRPDRPEGPARPSDPTSAEQVRVLGEQVIPKGLSFAGAPVGELSGIDYDQRGNQWYLLSDDSEEGPARYYTARFYVTQSGVTPVQFTSAQDILRSDGSTFPPLATNDPEVADPEAIRLDPSDRTLYWSSEGKREVPADGSAPALVDPWVRQMTTTGRNLREFTQPSIFTMSAAEQGPRRNAVFEGLTLTTDGKEIVTSMEGSLYQDGPLPTPTSPAVNRLTWYDKASGQPVRQVAYPLDPIPVAPIPPTAAADNGISEILAVDKDHYLVLERSFATGVGNSIRLYEIDLRGANNILRDPSLADGAYRPVTKRLVADFADLGLSHIDNVEGMSWGPQLRAGERSLVFVSDDNLSSSQVTQVIALGLR
ncbi:esterase-like activity of phytase family protein [Actinopolymorpha pittospori]|uniref:Phytase-like domain-containing protein n=1 Tax=Actinopolymorpha pittospori TaxID=648752 RepID=A0A927MW01_9ACTN|nr:esterase-like activity of phytase family protein [Actinopolymorpha pittospori]MBE1607926.1 hypothetical protein [Actinopolymorpha pittospori]